ncbi:60S ribosomal export protein NMD3 [Sulfuracidifex tepidarius]|uniref:Nmd3 N-terminal domain-containing protein n=1 Tax=Sulfuracidifex tepidarius TaxID=1294262 RepID=A0A510DYV9_9CREN|nr:60S ribosomal export protein NMD3 [Sulfuracidifex tepidarius]BBG25426.1 hypothetical protein IC006_2762 [Sulfuracidifex tepidarius]BBG28220.1 hypothetical protein IC007_2776 [Sulfuracidifex tepidarius]
MLLNTKKFCVSCGREDVELIDLLCPSCYSKRKEIFSIPRSINVKICKICGSQWSSGKWVKAGDLEDTVYAEIMKHANIDENVKEYKADVGLSKDKNGKDIAVVIFTGKIGNEAVSVRKDVYINIENSLCDSCMKKRGRFYDAIVQLRSKNGNLNEKRVFFESFFSREIVDNLSDVKIGREGIDYYFINRTVAKRLVSNIISMVKAEVKESFEGESLKNGKRSGKLVISLRI